MKHFYMLISVFFLKCKFILAQCAMCKASAETSVEAGSSQALGINNGVLYLIFFAFSALIFISYLIYKGNKSQSV